MKLGNYLNKNKIGGLILIIVSVCIIVIMWIWTILSFVYKPVAAASGVGAIGDVLT